MTWINQSSDFGDNTILPSSSMQILRNNRLAWTAGESGAPRLQNTAIDTWALFSQVLCNSEINLKLVNSGDSHNHDSNPLDFVAIDTYAINHNRLVYLTEAVGSHYLDAGSSNAYYPPAGFYHFFPDNTFTYSTCFEIYVNGAWRASNNELSASPGQHGYGIMAWCDGSHMRWITYGACYISYMKMF